MTETLPSSALTNSDAPQISAAYGAWKRYGLHFEEYACEFVGTAWLMFAIVAVVSFMFSSTSPMPRLLPLVPVRLFCAGALIGTSGSLFTVSPLGRLSGAHLNPAMSVGFLVLGKMHVKDCIGYVVSQLAGALLGSIIAKQVLGMPAHEIDQAALHQPSTVSLMLCLAGECAATFVYCYVIYTLVSHKSVMRWTPLLNVPLAASIVCLDGNVSGAGFNPARWFGPAVLTHTWVIWWVYSVAPIGAAALAALVRKGSPLAKHFIPATAKLFHDDRYRSIFRHDKVASAPPASVQSAAAPTL